MASKNSNWTLKAKLFAGLLSAGLIPLIIGGLIVNQQASDALETAAFNQLESIREVKSIEIEEYIKSIHDQVLTLSESPTTILAMSTLKRSFHNQAKGLETLSEAEFDSARAALKNFYTGQFGSEYQKQNDKTINASALMPTEPNEIYRQYRYIAQNEHPLGEKDTLDHAPLIGDTYDRVHQKYHPVFRSYLKRFGYYDIFLVDAKTGHIVYSVFKELDYGTSLTSGAYKNTNFARPSVEQSSPTIRIL